MKNFDIETWAVIKDLQRSKVDTTEIAQTELTKMANKHIIDANKSE